MPLLFDHRKAVFAHSAVRTDPVIRNIGKCGARADVVIRISGFRVIYVPTNVTHVFLHDSSPFSEPFSISKAPQYTIAQIPDKHERRPAITGGDLEDLVVGGGLAQG
jgi:hypothetical protein